MKKSYLLLMVLFACSTVAMQAQVKFGLKAGINMSKASLSTDMFDSENMTGFQIGPTVDFTVPIIGVGFDASLLYSQQGLKLEDAVDFKKIKQHTLDIPVNFKYKFDLVVMGAYLSTGPYVRFNLSDNVKDTWEAKSFGAGWNFGLGVELLSKVQVGLTYQLGFTDDFSGEVFDLDSSTFKELKAKPRTWVVSLAYFF